MRNKDFNKRIKELRKKKGLSQDELANLSGLSLRTIQRIEKSETNPLGDTKRKIINILEAHPDTDFSNEPKTVEKKDFLQKMVTKYEYPLILYILSLFFISMGFAGLPIVLFFGLAIGFLSIILLVISTTYHLKIKGLKKGIKYFVITLSSILLYFFVISLMFFSISHKG